MQLLTKVRVFVGHKCEYNLVKIWRPINIRCFNTNNFSPKKERNVDHNYHNYNSGHPYRNLYKWKSMLEFVEMLANNICYNDANLIAICKPWGVGTHKADVLITNKNAHLLNGVYSGSPKFCISDALEPLSQLINVKRLKLVKTADRFMSGIVLLVTNEETEKKVIKAINRSKPMQIPLMKFWCITNGWPVMDSNFLRERVGIKLVELDELGDHKESIIINSDQLTNNMKKRVPQRDGLLVKTVLTEMTTLEKNKTLSAALVEMSTTSTRWHFIECYLANKASFVLGDVRYSRRVKHILGTPMSVSPKKLNFDQDYEPLSLNKRNELQIKSNSYVPLMIHNKSITLPLYSGQKDLVIDSNINLIPKHFMWTLDRLGLQIPVNNELTNN